MNKIKKIFFFPFELLKILFMKIFNFYKNNVKKGCIYLEHILVWFIANFLFGLLPLIISVIIGNKNYDQIYSSFIAYIYTLVIVNIYVFENYFKTTKVHINLSWLLKWLSFFMAFVFIIYFILFTVKVNMVYPLDEQKMLSFSITIFLISVAIAFFLNFPSLRRNIKEEIQVIPITKMETAENNVDDIFKTLQQEG